MSDATQILNTLDNTRVTQRDYSDVQWQYVQDQNGGNFSNMVQFNTNILKTYFIDYHNGYIDLPISIKCATGADFTGNEPIAFRNSILQIFNQIMLTTDTGTTLVNENISPYYINALRLALENNCDYFDVMGGQLHMSNCIDKWLDVQSFANGNPFQYNQFAKNGDRLVIDWNTANHDAGTAAVMNDANKYLYQTITAVTPSSGTATTTPALPLSFVQGENKYCNPAFLQRIGIFKNMTQFDATGKQYYFHAMIPLALLHDFFRQFNMAVINLGLQLQLYFTQPDGILQNMQVFMTGAGVSSEPTKQPIISYGNNAFGGQGARLYVRNLKFNAPDSIRMNAKLAENYTKSINFLTTDYIPDRTVAPTVVNQTGGTFFQQEIVSAVVYPLRVWMLCYPDVAITSTAAALRWPLTSCPFYLDQANILINGVPLWKLPLTWPQDHWEMIRSQFPSETSTIVTYNDYTRWGSWMCFDLSRLGLERITSPTEPVSLTIQGNMKRGAGSAYESCKVIYLIERMNEITFSFGSTSTSLVVGNISLNNTA